MRLTDWLCVLRVDLKSRASKEALPHRAPSWRAYVDATVISKLIIDARSKCERSFRFHSGSKIFSPLRNSLGGAALPWCTSGFT